jgi:hypothetical protein
MTHETKQKNTASNPSSSDELRQQAALKRLNEIERLKPQ